MNIVLISSKGRCGIRTYVQTLSATFCDLGHRARYVGVEPKSNPDLVRNLRQVRRDDQLVIFEYDAGIFRLWGLIWAMAWMRLCRGKQVLLSVHEIAPEKFPETRQIQWHLSRQVSSRRLREILFLLPCLLDVMWRFLSLRLGMLLMAWLPHEVLVHYPKGLENVRWAVADEDRIRSVPLFATRLNGTRNAVRRELGISEGVFAFIIPGFIVRRKRIVEVIEQLPPDVELWIVGTESRHESGYLAEVRSYLADSPHRDRVRLIHDYERMEQYLIASDAVVLYYEDGYQSAVSVHMANEAIREDKVVHWLPEYSI